MIILMTFIFMYIICIFIITSIISYLRSTIKKEWNNDAPTSVPDYYFLLSSVCGKGSKVARFYSLTIDLQFSIQIFMNQKYNRLVKFKIFYQISFSVRVMTSSKNHVNLEFNGLYSISKKLWSP